MKNSKDKTNSTMQKQVNRLKKRCTELQQTVEKRKQYVRSTSEFIQFLLSKNRIMKSELAPYYKRKNSI
jgi:uncharacterized protein YlxW (UPF0749 family)